MSDNCRCDNCDKTQCHVCSKEIPLRDKRRTNIEVSGVDTRDVVVCSQECARTFYMERNLRAALKNIVERGR